MRVSFVTLLFLLLLPLTSMAQEEVKHKEVLATSKDPIDPNAQTWIEYIDTHVATTRKGFRHRTTITRRSGLPAFRLGISAPGFRVKGPLDPTGFSERRGGPMMPGMTITFKF